MSSIATLAELIGRRITVEVKDQHQPKIEILTAPIRVDSEKLSYRYEAEVFNFLLTNKGSLGINSVMKFTALLVDGAVELDGGDRLTVEIKYRMNWGKACQAEWQFRSYRRRNTTKAFPVSGGLVFFEEFQGDGWDRRAKSRFLANGWSEWYRSHSEVDGLHLHLLRLHEGKLEGFSDRRRHRSQGRRSF